MSFNRVVGLPTLQTLPTLSLNGKRHYILPDKVVVPSVTSLLGHFEEKGIRRWKAKVGIQEANKISEASRAKGESFHLLAEHYLNNTDLNTLLAREEHQKFGPLFTSSFMKVLVELNKINNIHYQEKCLYSHKLRLAGRVDLIAEYDGVLSVVDFKTSKKEKKEEYIQNYFEQATSYALMYEEFTGIKIPKIVIIIGVMNEELGLTETQVFVRNPDDYVDRLKEKISAYFSGKELV